MADPIALAFNARTCHNPWVDVIDPGDVGASRGRGTNRMEQLMQGKDNRTDGGA